MNSQPIKHDRRRCIVPGCLSTRKAKHHVFPKDEAQGRPWVEAVSNPLLNNLTYKQIHEKGYRVCELHFSPDDYLCGPRNVFRKKLVPSLLLPKKNVSNVPSEVLQEKSIDYNHEQENECPSPSRTANLILDMGCLLCAAESQKSPTYSRTSSSNPSLENVRTRTSASQEQIVHQKKTEEIYANPRNHYPSPLPTAAIRMPYYSGLKKADSVSDWGTEHGDLSEDHPVYEGRQYQQKSYCSLIKKDEPEASNSEIRVNRQIVSECSRRPIRCPRLDCAMTVALSALTHHFLFDHPEVPILSVEPEGKSTLIVSFSALTYGSTKCLAVLLVSGKLSAAAANLFNGCQIHAKYRNRLPLTVLAARLKCTNQYGTRDEMKAGGEGHDRGDLIIAWVAGPDFASPAMGALRCSIQAVDGLESEVFRSLTYSGPINSLRKAQRPQEIYSAGDCVVLHEGFMNQISSGCTSLIVNVIIH